MKLFTIPAKIGLICSLALFLLNVAQAKNPYPALGDCNGLPRIAIKSPKNTCVGVLAFDLKMPRGVLPITDSEIWLTEMGSWEKGRGRLSLLLKSGNTYTRYTVLDKLDRPHGIALGADGWVYVAESSRVIRLNPKSFDANRKGPKTPEYSVVVDGLPNTGRHPLKQIVFNAQGNLLLSMGSQTDHCEQSQSALSKVNFPCTEAQGARANASIWKISQLKTVPKIELFATGIRNAMGMSFAENGELWVTDNGRDAISHIDKKLNDAELPHDEINVVKQHGDYGWPYCYDRNILNPEYRAYTTACENKIPPHILLPAHSAPLGIMRYPKNGEITMLRGLHLVALHGYRDTGHRVIALPYTELLSGWHAIKDQPMGAPVELRASPSGKIYITDDRNGVLLRWTNTK